MTVDCEAVPAPTLRTGIWASLETLPTSVSWHDVSSLKLAQPEQPSTSSVSTTTTVRCCYERQLFMCLLANFDKCIPSERRSIYRFLAWMQTNKYVSSKCSSLYYITIDAVDLFEKPTGLPSSAVKSNCDRIHRWLKSAIRDTRFLCQTFLLKKKQQ